MYPVFPQQTCEEHDGKSLWKGTSWFLYFQVQLSFLGGQKLNILLCCTKEASIIRPWNGFQHDFWESKNIWAKDYELCRHFEDKDTFSAHMPTGYTLNKIL